MARKFSDSPTETRKVYRASSQTLRQFHASPARVRFVRGPVGSGKTTACIWELFKLAKEQQPNHRGMRRSRWLVVRASYPELEQATLPSWFEEVPEQLGTFTWTKPYQHHIRFDDVQMEVVFMGLDEPDGPEKLKGMQFTGAWINEVVTVPLSVITMVLRRIDRFPPKQDVGATRACVIGDTNAPEEGHWYHKYETAETPAGWEFFVQPAAVVWSGQEWVVNGGADNLDNLSQEYYPGQIAGSSDDEIRVLLANEFGFIVRGAAIFPEYDDRTHTRAYDPDPRLPLAIGADFGLTPAAVFTQRVPSGQVRVLSELVTENMGAARFAEAVKQHCNSLYAGMSYEFMVGDPRGDTRAQTDERTVFQILQASDLPFRGAHTNDFVIRREAVAKLLSQLVTGVGEPALVFHPRCVVLRKGMSGGYLYKRKRQAEEAYEREPAKNRFSHVCDALQYLVLGYGVGRTVIQRPRRKTMRQQVRALGDYDVFMHR